MIDAQLLPANRFEHFYRGGARIAALRGGPPGPRLPEEWLASTTTRAGDPGRGLSRLADGSYLRDAVLADPTAWLGPSHVDRFGASTELLVKLLDAGERLPVHVHPDRVFAQQHLGIPHGKTEAWLVIDADPGAQVRLGFAGDMRLSDVRALIDLQEPGALVAGLRPCPVQAGEAVLVPAGLPHCIDSGIFVVELQEPTDLSILLEWTGYAVDGRKEGHLGLGFDVALGALRLDALGDEELHTLVYRPADGEPGLRSALPPVAEPYFRAHRLTEGPDAPPVEPGFAVVLAMAGQGRLITEHAADLDLRRGDVAVVPWCAGSWRVEGLLDAVVCRPPLPAMPDGPP